LCEEEHQRVEGAGACGVGAVLFEHVRVQTPAAIVVSGGNIDAAKLESLLTPRQDGSPRPSH
jgi:threonine dehydratase